MNINVTAARAAAEEILDLALRIQRYAVSDPAVAMFIPDCEAIDIAWQRGTSGVCADPEEVKRIIRDQIATHGRYVLLARRCAELAVLELPAAAIDGMTTILVHLHSDNLGEAVRAGQAVPDFPGKRQFLAHLDMVERGYLGGGSERYWATLQRRDGSGRIWEGLLAEEHEPWISRAQKAMAVVTIRAARAALAQAMGEKATLIPDEVFKQYAGSADGSPECLVAAIIGNPQYRAFGKIVPVSDLFAAARKALVSDSPEVTELVQAYLNEHIGQGFELDILNEAPRFRTQVDADLSREFVDLALEIDCAMPKALPAPAAHGSMELH